MKPNQSFQRKSLSSSQLKNLLKMPNCSLIELMDVIPPFETMDSESRQLLKRLCLSQFVSTENQHVMHAEASQILVGLYLDCEEKSEMLADLIEAHIDSMMTNEKCELKRRSMFRSNSSVTFLAYTLCVMLQNSPDPDIFTLFAQLLTEKAARQPEAMILMKLLCTDLARSLAQSHVEIPAALMLSKAITLHLIYLVQEKHSEMVPSLTVFLVDLLNGFLSCCG